MDIKKILADLIAVKAGERTAAAMIDECGATMEDVAAAAAAERERVQSDHETDSTITPEYVDALALVSRVIHAATTAKDEPAATETTPEPETETEEPDTGTVDTTTNEEGDAVNDDTSATPTEGELVAAGTGPAAPGNEGFSTTQGRDIDLNMSGDSRPSTATMVPLSTRASVEQYDVFTSDGSQVETVGDMIADVHSRMGSIRNARIDGRLGASVIRYQMRDEHKMFARTPGMSDHEVDALINRAIAYHTAELVKADKTGTFASNGFCAPSVDQYEFCPVPTPWGLFGQTIPTILSPRGGNRWPVEPGIGDMWGEGIGCWTEAEEMAREDLKPCTELGCPGWVDYRDNICSICVTSSVLADRAFPEWTANQMRKFQLIYEMWINWQMLQTALNIARAQTGIDGDDLRWNTRGYGIFNAMQEKIAYTFNQFEARTLFGPNGIRMNVAFPWWAYDAIRADVGKRTGLPVSALSDQQINAVLSSGRNVSFHPLSLWNTSVVAPPDTPDLAQWMGSSESLAAGVYPETIPMLIWPEGAFIGVRDDFLDIRGRWDYGLQRDNKQLQWFAETQWNVIPRCFEAYSIVIDSCVSGRTSAPVNFPCNPNDGDVTLLGSVPMTPPEVPAGAAA